MKNLIRENPRALVFSSFHLVQSFAIFLVVPFLSLILLENGWKTAEITYFFAIFTFAMFLFSPIIGRISDEIGRKKVILFGIFTQAIFFLVYYFFPTNHTLLLFTRFLDGIGFACVSIVVLSAFQDLIEEKRGFWTGLFLSVGTIGSFFAPIIAGYIATWYLNKILLLIGFFFLVLSFVFLLFIPESKPKKRNVKLNDFDPFSEIFTFLSYRKFRGMAFIGILMNSKGEIFSIFFPIYVITVLGYPEYYLGFFLAIPAFLHIFQFYFGKISDAVSSEFGVLFGVFLVSGSMVFLPHIQSLPALIILLLVYGIGGAIWNVNAWSLMSKIAKEKDIQGEVVGSYISLAKLGMFFAALVSAYLVSIFGIAQTIQLFAIIIFIANFGTYLFLKPIFHHEKITSPFGKYLKKHL